MTRLTARFAPVRTAHAWFDGDAPGGAPAPPPADATPPAADPVEAPKADAKDTTPDLAAIQKELREARREAASFRTELKRYQDAEAQSKQAAMSETEKLQAQLAELTRGVEERDARIKAMDLRAAVNRSASKLGFADPEDALSLLDASAIEYAEDGKPRNLDHLLGDLIRAKPYLKASYNQPADMYQGSRGAAPGTLTREQLARMTTEQIMALPPAEVDAAMSRA